MKAVGELTGIRGHWKSILSVIVLGVLGILIDYGFFFTFILSAIGAFLFHLREKHYRVFLEFMSRVSLAATGALLLEFTNVGMKVILMFEGVSL